MRPGISAASPPHQPHRQPVAAPISDWARASAADGRQYWYSLSSGATTWDDPAASPPAATVPATSSVVQKEEESPWRETRTDDGRIYYYNASTKQTQWERPADMPASTAAGRADEAKPRDGTEAPLPAGWAQNTTSDGRVYYYHAATRETRWDRPIALVASAEPQKKRPVAEMTPSVPAQTADDWKEHTAPDGRTYFYNTSTRETSWSNPSREGDAPDRKRARVEVKPVNDLRQAIARSREQKAAEKGRPEKGVRVVRRPRSQEGKTLTDHQAETYFLNRAKIRRGAAGGDESAEMKDGTDSEQLQTDEQREKVFYELLRERGIGEKSTWLETMSRCSDDARYTVLQPYGARKHAWLKWTQKCAKQERRRAIVATREKSEALLALMEETFVNEPVTVATLERCNPDAVRKFEADGRYRAVDERTRSGLIKSFFGVRERKGKREHAQKRKECLVKMRDALDGMVDPSIMPPREAKKAKEVDKMDEDSNGKQKPNGQHTASAEPEGNEHKFLSDRTPFRELDRFLSTIPGSEAVDSNDRAGIIRDWRKVVERLVYEKRAREREARKALQKERRAEFRSGVEKMILEGRIPITARWKEVAELIVKESFAVPEEELDARPSDLYADAQMLFEDRVQAHREEFKRLLRDEKIEIQDVTTVEDLQKADNLDKFIKGLDRPVVDALLADRQRKESKKRQKELRGAMADFEKLLHRSELSAESTFEKATELWKDRTAFKQLHAIVGTDGVRKVYEEYMQRKKVRDEKAREHQNRLKRKFEEQSAPPPFDHEALAALERAKRIRLPGAPVQPMPFRAPPVEEESGWAAALSSKPMTEKEKLEAKERRKRELLEGLGSQGS